MSAFIPDIVVYCCENCLYGNSDTASQPPVRANEVVKNIELIEIPCTSKINVVYMMRAFERGIDGILVIGCKEDNCTFLQGSKRALKRIEFIQETLAEIKVNPERIQIELFKPPIFESLESIIQDFSEHIEKLGPSSVRIAMNNSGSK